MKLLATALAIGLAGPAANAADLFRGEGPDTAMTRAAHNCLDHGSAEQLRQCKYYIADNCDATGLGAADTCFLREAASLDDAMRSKYTIALERMREADAFERDRGRPARSETLLQQSQILFEAYRGIACEAEAEPFGSDTGEGARTYVICLIDLTAHRALQLEIWGLI